MATAARHVEHFDASMVMSPSVTTILASYNCTAACEHCCFDSHPGIEKRLTLDEILSFIDQARQFKTMRLIVFSGGECFLLGKDLDAAVAHASSLGLGTRCVTNGYWARTERKASERLAGLAAAGLDEINISTGDFHQEFVPERSVINGICAAVALGIRSVIVIELQKERAVTAQRIKANPRIQEILRGPRPDMLKIIESPWMPMSSEATIEQRRERFTSAQTVHQRNGCQSVLTTIVATPNNQMGACCGLSRELIPELNMGLEGATPVETAYRKAASDFMKIWLFVEGPERILAWAAGKDPSIEWEYRYAHHCHTCLALFENPKVRSVVRAHYEEKMEEVLLRFSLLVRAGKIRSPDLGPFSQAFQPHASRRTTSQTIQIVSRDADTRRYGTQHRAGDPPSA